MSRHPTQGKGIFIVYVLVHHVSSPRIIFGRRHVFHLIAVGNGLTRLLNKP